MSARELIGYLVFVGFAILASVPSIIAQFVFLRRQKKMFQDSPFFASWKRLQSELADTLHHPHPEAQETDHLLEELETVTLAGVSGISTVDRARLIELLKERAADTEESSSERTRAELLLIAMRRVEQDDKNITLSHDG